MDQYESSPACCAYLSTAIPEILEHLSPSGHPKPNPTLNYQLKIQTFLINR